MQRSVERLEKSDLRFHRMLLRKLQAAVDMQQLWRDFLTEEYALEAGDKVTEEGVVIRVSQGEGGS